MLPRKVKEKEKESENKEAWGLYLQGVGGDKPNLDI